MVGVLTACTSQADIDKSAPDYSSYKDQFITFAYSSPTNGQYTEDGTVYFTGEDYRTAERYKEYKDAGLNTMMIQRVDPYNGEEWTSSQLKKNMDNCVTAGLERCIVFDERLYGLSEKNYNTKKVVPDLYATQDDLVTYVKECMKDYSKHEVYYGMMLMDEPSIKKCGNFKNYGAVYRAIMTASKQLGVTTYIESNLLPYHTNESIKAHYVEDTSAYTQEEAYDKYLSDFIEETGTKKILMDSYPICYDGASYTLLDSHIRCLQLIANKCKEKGLEFNAVAQTTAYSNNGKMSHGTLNAATMNWQMNMYMGYGVTKFGYFTYWRKKENSSTGEWFIDGSSFMSQFGEKTDLYYVMQNLHTEMQKFAPVISQFDYQGSAKYVTGPSYSTAFIDAVKNDTFTMLDNVTISDQRTVLVTELKEQKTGNYMYMVMNAANPDLTRGNRNITADITLSFKNSNAVSSYYKGNKTNIPLDGSKLSIKLDPGYAMFVIPYNAK